jgi:lipase chaperone LimK
VSPIAKAALTAAVAFALLAAAVLVLSSGAQEQIEPAQRRVAPVALPAARSAGPSARRALPPPAEERPLKLGPLPASLRDTEPDGPIEADASGHLILGPGVRRFFEYWLSAEGEESAAALRTRLQTAARARLPSAAAAELEALFDRYLRYREAGHALAAGDADLELRRARVTTLRRAQLGDAAAAALFADEDALDALALARRRLQLDRSIGAADHAASEAALEAQLPPSLRAARAATTAPARLDAEEAAMRAAGATDGDIQAVRIQASGPEAAARLRELDRARVDWQARVSDFRARRAALAAGESDPAALERKVHELVISMFSEPEQVRIAALERADGAR